MKDGIGAKVKALEKKQDSEIKRIESEYDAKIKAVIADYKKDDSYGDYNPKFDLKRKTVMMDRCGRGFAHNSKPCNRWSKKKDWLIVEIEDYNTFTTLTDCGYGDYDECAMFRVIERYEVCPKCGRMTLLSTEKFEHGPGRTRYEDAEGFDIRPVGWVPRVKIVRNAKKEKIT